MLEALTLHQLRVLLVLLEERSVTRAARRLGVSQPALSHALRGLRDALGDPLLVSARGGLVPTARAEAVAPALRRALHELEGALRSGAADEPRTWSRTLVLATWDGMSLSVLPRLLARVGAEAPGLCIDVRPVPPEGAAAGLGDGSLDLAIEVRPAEAPGLRTRSLGTDTFACVVRRDHPAVGVALDLDTWLALPHALISPQGRGTTVVDSRLGELGRKRHVALRIRYFLAAPLVVAASDLVLTAPRSLCEQMAELAPLRVFEPPLVLAPFSTRMVWHERADADPVHRWLRDAVVDAVTARPSGEIARR